MNSAGIVCCDSQATGQTPASLCIILIMVGVRGLSAAGNIKPSFLKRTPDHQKTRPNPGFSSGRAELGRMFCEQAACTLRIGSRELGHLGSGAGLPSGGLEPKTEAPGMGAQVKKTEQAHR